MSADGNQFGIDRFEAELRAVSSIPVEGGVERLLRVVEEWTGQTGPQDDISIIALEVGGMK